MDTIVSDHHSNRAQYTVALIKPDAVRANHVDAILLRIQQEGFTILRQETRQLERDVATAFYKEHQHEPWFDEIIDFMCSGPLIILALSRADAIKTWRDVIGHRWPPVARERDPTCLRARFGTQGCGANAVHGSDSEDAVQRELTLFGWSDLVRLKLD